MLEEEKTDSESSCLLFEKEKRLPERMHYVCGENGLGKQLFLLRKRKSGYPKGMKIVASLSVFIAVYRYLLIILDPS